MKTNYDTAPTPTVAAVMRLLGLLALVLTVTMFVACNTSGGFGTDVNGLGSNVEASAARNK